MYSHDLNPNLILGYHGCDNAIGEHILRGNPFKPSANAYDWLGDGIYFWESNPRRAYSFACEQQKRGRIKKPFVVGAVLSLGSCIDTLSEQSINSIKVAHRVLKQNTLASKEVMPKNKGGRDILFRYLDRAVIMTLHKIVEEQGQSIDSVRGLYHEGGRIYSNSGFYNKSHIQIAICNPERIKGVFRVRPEDYM